MARPSSTIAWIAIAALVCLMFVCRWQTSSPGLIKPEDRDTEFELATKFRVHGHLMVRRKFPDRHMFPVALFLQLERKGLSKVITSMRDLDGEVSIRNDAEALQFVRLATHHETLWWGIAGTGEIFEVVPRKELNESFTLGDKGLLGWLKEGQNNELFAGVVPDDWFAKHKLKPPSVEATSKGWTIHRLMVKDNRVRPGTETVTPDGGYSLTLGSDIAIEGPYGSWKGMPGRD